MTKFLEKSWVWVVTKGTPMFKDGLHLINVYLPLDEAGNLKLDYETEIFVGYMEQGERKFAKVKAIIVEEVSKNKPWYKVLPGIYIENDGVSYYRINGRWYYEIKESEEDLECGMYEGLYPSEDMSELLDEILKKSVIRF